MSNWIIKYLDESIKDLKKIDSSLYNQIFAGLEKVSQNPLSQSEGGYGKPLGADLVNMFKIKYRNIGIRVVYTLVRKDKVMNIVTISIRDESKCYEISKKRKEKYGKQIFENIFNSLKK